MSGWRAPRLAAQFRWIFNEGREIAISLTACGSAAEVAACFTKQGKKRGTGSGARGGATPALRGGGPAGASGVARGERRARARRCGDALGAAARCIKTDLRGLDRLLTADVPSQPSQCAPRRRRAVAALPPPPRPAPGPPGPAQRSHPVAPLWLHPPAPATPRCIAVSRASARRAGTRRASQHPPAGQPGRHASVPPPLGRHRRRRRRSFFFRLAHQRPRQPRGG